MSRDLGRDVPDLEKLYARKLWADFAIPIALYRPHFGPQTRNVKKWQKMAFGPTGNFSAMGPKSVFRPFFPPFGSEARNGVCTGQSGSQG